jgi:Ca2+-binding EF-hand superfamily protein
LKLDEIVLTPQELSQIKDIFDLFDTDGGGSIDGDEMDSAMYALGFQPTLAIAHKKSKEIASPDAGGKKGITLEEFTSLMKGELMIASPLDTIWAAFAALSYCDEQGELQQKPVSRTGRNALVTLDGLKRACRDYDVMLSDEELKIMMDEIDTNHSGTVERKEFMRIMHNAPWF